MFYYYYGEFDYYGLSLLSQNMSKEDFEKYLEARICAEQQMFNSIVKLVKDGFVKVKQVLKKTKERKLK